MLLAATDHAMRQPSAVGSWVILFVTASAVALLVISTVAGCGTSSESGVRTGMQDVQSSALRSVGYAAGSQTLAITFESGSTYEYSGVPRHVYEELLSAPSKGTYFNTHVKGRYSCRRIRQDNSAGNRDERGPDAGPREPTNEPPPGPGD